jgi:hypothetical protein
MEGQNTCQFLDMEHEQLKSDLEKYKVLRTENLFKQRRRRLELLGFESIATPKEKREGAEVPEFLQRLKEKKSRGYF